MQRAKKLQGNTIFECRNTLSTSASRSWKRFTAHTQWRWSMHPFTMNTICELHAVIRFLSAQGETVVNVSIILLDTYAEEGLPDNSITCQWWREFLANDSSLKDGERSGWPCDCISVPYLHLTLKNYCSVDIEQAVINKYWQNNYQYWQNNCQH